MAYWGLDIDSIMRQVNQRRAAGGYVSPNMIQDLIKANISNASQQSATQQSLENQAAGVANQTKGVELQGQSIAETARANAASEALRNKTLDQSVLDTAAARALNEKQFGVTSAEKEREFNTNVDLVNKARESTGTSNIASTLVQAPSNIMAGKKVYDWMFPDKKIIAGQTPGNIETPVDFGYLNGMDPAAPTDITGGTPAPVGESSSAAPGSLGDWSADLEPGGSYTPYDPAKGSLADSTSLFAEPTLSGGMTDAAGNVIGSAEEGFLSSGGGGANLGSLATAAESGAGGIVGGVAGGYLGNKYIPHEQGGYMGGLLGGIGGATAVGGPVAGAAVAAGELLRRGYEAFTGQGPWKDEGPSEYMRWLNTPEGQAFDKADQAALRAREAEEDKRREAEAMAKANPWERIWESTQSTVDPWGNSNYARNKASNWAADPNTLNTSTWLCTEIARFIGLTDDDNAALSKLRRYSIKNHMKWIRVYWKDGEAIVGAINAREEPKAFYAKLKREMVAPVIELAKAGELEAAFKKYKADTISLVKDYSPELMKEIESF